MNKVRIVNRELNIAIIINIHNHNNNHQANTVNPFNIIKYFQVLHISSCLHDHNPQTKPRYKKIHNQVQK